MTINLIDEKTPTANLSIRPAMTIEDCRIVEQMQVDVWGAEPLDVVPDHMLLTPAKNGGILLLAELDGQPVGFVFSFQGESAGGERKHCSHMLAVLPQARQLGIAYRLKLAQREASLAQGIALMTWTFDPLLSKNAQLNIAKLGATSQTYYRELYGSMRDSINAGLPSDRLEVDWRLDSPTVAQKLAGSWKPPSIWRELILNPATHDTQGLLSPADSVSPLTESTHFVQIPADINALKTADFSLAMAWRAQTRGLFETAFAAGYAITDFVRNPESVESYYQLTKPI